mmetsp:Transcript_28672/g.64042  ORF Transcript_28672/g.64042 Transcript_28672/m.64042 type:complete len:315 (+) Transcript_28672:404-1348(+)
MSVVLRKPLPAAAEISAIEKTSGPPFEDPGRWPLCRLGAAAGKRGPRALGARGAVDGRWVAAIELRRPWACCVRPAAIPSTAEAWDIGLTTPRCRMTTNASKLYPGNRRFQSPVGYGVRPLFPYSLGDFRRTPSSSSSSSPSPNRPPLRPSKPSPPPSPPRPPKPSASSKLPREPVIESVSLLSSRPLLPRPLVFGSVRAECTMTARCLVPPGVLKVTSSPCSKSASLKSSASRLFISSLPPLTSRPRRRSSSLSWCAARSSSPSSSALALASLSGLAGRLDLPVVRSLSGILNSCAAFTSYMRSCGGSLSLMW